MKNKLKYIPTLILTLVTVFAGMVLSSSGADAALTGSKDAVVNVLPACTFTNSDSAYTIPISLAAGTNSNADGTTVGVNCNEITGFFVQAVGFSPDGTHPDGLEGNTAMYGSQGTISTGTSGSNSYWAFKVKSATSSTSYTIASGYDDYANVPSSATTIVTYGAPTTVGTAVTGNFIPNYKVSVSSTQAAGAYTGAVKYTLASNT